MCFPISIQYWRVVDRETDIHLALTYATLSMNAVFVVLALRVAACENEILTVNCYQQDVIQIINAHYGRLETDTCDANIGTSDTECLINGTRAVVYAR